MGQSQQTKIINAKLKAKEWQWEIKSEVKNLDKEIGKIDKEIQKLQKQAKLAGEKSQNAGAKSIVQNYAKQIVRSRQAIQRLEKAKANLHTVDLQVTTMMATMSTTSSITISAGIMARMNKIANTEGISDAMRKMKDEMSKCQMAEDRMEEAFADEDEEVEVGVEMDRVMEEIGLDAAVFGVLSRPTPEAIPPVAQSTAPAPAPKAALAEGMSAPVPPKAPLVQSQPQQFEPPVQPPADQSGYPSGLQPFQTLDAPSAPPPVTPSAPPPVAPSAPQPPVEPSNQPTRGGDEDDLLARLAALKK
jgi:division protein CdvB (Snf7/Vps24/ESCRT-III family)